MSAFTISFSRTHTAIFVADNTLNVLRDIIKWSGLDPINLLGDWQVLSDAMRIWLIDGDLLSVTIEFHLPNAKNVVTRWDLGIKFDGSGIDDDMWVARDHIRRTIEKAPRPPSNAEYTIILSARPGRQPVKGMVPAEYRSTAGLISRDSGTAIATPDIMASITYWRAA